MPRKGGASSNLDWLSPITDARDYWIVRLRGR
jgi:hypothetical protein